MKMKHTNGIIYHKSLRVLAKKFNVSANTIRVYMKEFKRLGMITETERGYHFTKQSTLTKNLGLEKVCKRLWRDINIDYTKSIKQFSFLLEGQLIVKNIEQQQYKINKKKENFNLTKTLRDGKVIYGKKGYKKTKNFIKKLEDKSILTKTDEEIANYYNINAVTTISNKSIGGLISRCASTGGKRLKSWNDSNILISEARYEKLGDMPYEMFKQLKRNGDVKQYSFYKNGSAYQRLSNKVEIVNLRVS
jgi:hypothetical protein